MLTAIIKFLFVYFFCIFIYGKSLTIFNYSFKGNLTISLILAIISSFLSEYFKGLDFFLPLLLFWIITNIIHSTPQTSFVALTISFTISFSIYATVSFILAFLVVPFFNTSTYFPLLALASGIIQAFIFKKVFSTKRFRKGIPFLSSSMFINFATLFCLLFIGFTTYISFDYELLYVKAIGFCSFIISLAFLIYWWQAQITKSYRRSLELRELESLRTEIVEKDILIQKLLKENDRLATITHRDNTLISTLTNSACNYLMTDYANPAVAIEARDSLIANIKKLSDGRLFLPDDYNKKKARDFDTGFSLLDEMLHHMDEDAIEMDITFSVHMGVMPGDFVPRDISEMELVHLVDDLLKNAFKAARNPESRMVQLQFYRLGKHFVVEVSDNGIPFEVKSLVNMGIEKMTSYEDGSGIGLMDIWNTKEKYGATYHLEEYAAPSPFSKKISLTFDKKNRYSIRTWRKDEILQMSKRADLQVYGHNE